MIEKKINQREGAMIVVITSPKVIFSSSGVLLANCLMILKHCKECLRNVLLKIMIKTYGRNTAAGIGEFLGHLLHYYIICYTTVLWSKNMSFQLSAFWQGPFFRHNFPRGGGAIFPLGFFWGTFFLSFFRWYISRHRYL